MVLSPLAERLSTIKEAQAEYQMLCEMWNRRADHCGLTGDDMVDSRRNIDETIRECGFNVTPTNGCTWRYERWMGEGEEYDFGYAGSPT